MGISNPKSCRGPSDKKASYRGILISGGPTTAIQIKDRSLERENVNISQKA